MADTTTGKEFKAELAKIDARLKGEIRDGLYHLELFDNIGKKAYKASDEDWAVALAAVVTRLMKGRKVARA